MLSRINKGKIYIWKATCCLQPNRNSKIFSCRKLCIPDPDKVFNRHIIRIHGRNTQQFIYIYAGEQPVSPAYDTFHTYRRCGIHCTLITLSYSIVSLGHVWCPAAYSPVNWELLTIGASHDDQAHNSIVIKIRANFMESLKFVAMIKLTGIWNIGDIEIMGLV